MDVDTGGFNYDQKNKSIVLALSIRLTELHVAQEMHGAVDSVTYLGLWLDENHRLSDGISIQMVKNHVHLGHRLFRDIVFPIYRPMCLLQIVGKAIIRSGALSARDAAKLELALAGVKLPDRLIAIRITAITPKTVRMLLRRAVLQTTTSTTFVSKFVPLCFHTILSESSYLCT